MLCRTPCLSGARQTGSKKWHLHMNNSDDSKTQMTVKRRPSPLSETEDIYIAAVPFIQAKAEILQMLI